MLGKRSQIVIGIGVIILSAAFLLVGVYFANLQGLFFQNGARSLQLFANNIGSTVNSLYSAPSSMSITLNGNSSLCTWDPSIAAYTCAGGSKVYNISYANGPTLDSGKNIFSIALCFMVGYGFGGVGGSKSAVTETADDSFQVSDEAAQAFGALFGDDVKETEEGVLYSEEAAADDAGSASEESSSLLSKIGQKIKSKVITHVKELFIQDIPEDSLLSGSFSNIQDALRQSSIFIPAAVASMSAALIAVPLIESWFGTSARNLNTYITKGVFADGIQVGALTGPSVSISQQIAAAYVTQEPLPFKYAATDYVLQQYSQLLSSTQTLNSLPSSLGKDNLILLASKQAAVEGNVISELSSNAQSTANSNPYSTPTSGASAPGTLSSPDSLIGSVSLSSTGKDPFLSLPFFLAQNAFMVYARTASCLSIPSQSGSSYNSVKKGFSSAISDFGALTTFLNVYDKVNSVLPLGTYFVGYGGEVYVNGYSSGRPTQVTSPVITDMNDMCELAETSSQPGQNLRTVIEPSGNGSITFSISQGLYNTFCSKNNALFPNTLQTDINNVLKSKANKISMTVLLPPGDALAMSNGAKSTNLCIYSMLIDSFGAPVISTSNFASSVSNVMEYGSPISCVNLTNLTSGKANFGIEQSELSQLNNNMLSSNDFYINNNSLIGFSVPVTDFPDSLTAGNSPSSTFLSAGNFIGGGEPVLKTDLGVDFPVVSFIDSFIGKKAPKFQTSISNALGAFLVYPLYTLSATDTNLSYYETDYANVTLSLTKIYTGNETYYNISSISDNLVFGVYPNNNNSFGGTYFSGN